jgi:hypothetical protein
MLRAMPRVTVEVGHPTLGDRDEEGPGVTRRRVMQDVPEDDWAIGPVLRWGRHPRAGA